MDNNMQENNASPTVPNSTKKWQINTLIALIAFLIILLAFILYFSILKKPTNNSTVSSKTVINTNTKNNSVCKTEGTATSAMFPTKLYPNQPSESTILQDQNIAAKNWENNSYLVTSILSAGITAGPDPHGAYIYASSCTKDLLIYYGVGSGLYTSPNSNQSYDKPIIIKNLNNFSIPFNKIQISYNTTLPLSNANNFPSFVTPQKNGPIIYNSTNYSNSSSTTNNITIANKSFYAQQYTVQVNNSKKSGIFYDIMFYSNNTNTPKLVALATISNTGHLLTFKIY